ncbi:MAG: hypothetical protein JNL98_43970 [Bryobacterales bacterium]|nr:hypothetical protein [Bryobacterales bacterium]
MLLLPDAALGEANAIQSVGSVAVHGHENGAVTVTVTLEAAAGTSND